MIDMRPVVNESSTVAAVGYDAERQILGVRFHSSARVYTYAGVPADVAEGLRTADSPGKFFAARIKGRYQPPEQGKE